MPVRDVRGRLAALTIVAAAGLLHRRAVVDVWADDRALSGDPGWLQMAAPFWHAAVHGSISVANGLVRLADPMTGASTAGDTRALAALLTASSAGALFLVFRRAGVPLIIGMLLCGATVASVLPVTIAASVSHALLMLLGTALILTWSVPSSSGRVLLLAAITLAGAATHASFLAFATGIWTAELWRAERGTRVRVAVLATATLAMGLLVSSWLLAQPGVARFSIGVERPGTWELATGLLTGRFTPPMQPSQMVDLLSAVYVSLPAPTILSIPLALLGFVRRDTRTLAVACALTLVLLVSFLWGTWLPDPRVAGAPARLAVVVLIGLGLSWVAVQPGRGAMTLALLASALIGLRGFVEPTPWSVSVALAKLHAFVDAAPTVLDRAAWSADRLSVSRALLSAHPAIGASRVPIGPEALAVVPDDRPVIAIGDVEPRSAGRIGRVPFDIAYPSAEHFLAAQPNRLWMGVALHGRATAGFCRDLLAHLDLDPQVASAVNPALLVRIGNREPRVSLSATDRLDVEYGRVLSGAPEPVPARVSIEADTTARITINRQIAARATDGMAIATFDPWTAGTEQWIVGPCERPMSPAIREDRLAAAHTIPLAESIPSLRIPAVSAAPLNVRFDVDDWFGSGWHAAEGHRDEAFRWSGARDAHVNVPAAHAQPIRVRMSAALAAAPGTPNALGLSWNGTIIRPLGPWANDAELEWLVPESAVKRGINVFTIHVDHLVSPGPTDPRMLGAVVRQLSFAPAADTRR